MKYSNISVAYFLPSTTFIFSHINFPKDTHPGLSLTSDVQTEELAAKITENEKLHTKVSSCTNVHVHVCTMYMYMYMYVKCTCMYMYVWCTCTCVIHDSNFYHYD